MPALSRGVALLMLVGAALGWSISGVLIKGVLWNPLAIAGARSLISAVVMLPFLRRERFTFSAMQWGGALAYAGTMITFVAANKYTTAANAILLQYTAPVYVALFGAWFLGESPRRLDWAATALAFCGVLLFFVDDLSPGRLSGNMLGLASGVCFAWIALFMRRMRRGGALESIFLGNLVTGAVSLPFLLEGSPGGSGWTGLLLLGVVQLGIPYILFGIATRYVTAMEAILVPFLEPILNPVWTFLLLGEAPGRLALVGGVLVLLAVGGRAAIPQFMLARTHRGQGVTPGGGSGAVT